MQTQSKMSATLNWVVAFIFVFSWSSVSEWPNGRLGSAERQYHDDG